MSVLYFGIILLLGYILSVFVEKLGFPKIVGYLTAGLLLNPEVVNFIPSEFIALTKPVTSFCLAFITFEIGSSFSLKDLRATGKKYFNLAFFESFSAFVLLFIIFFIISTYFLPFTIGGVSVSVAFSLLLASLGAPTDPSATLAVIHEYKAKGPVTRAVLGAAAFDDIITLILFSFSMSVSHALLGGQETSFFHVSYIILYKILGAVITGIVFGFIFNKLTSIFKVNEKRSLMILFFGFLSVTFGLAIWLKFDELFSTLTLGFVIRNFNKSEKKILSITEHALEDLFFLIFFVFSALHFSFKSVSFQLFILISIFILVRMTGKYLGMRSGSHILKMSKNVKKYAFGGLIPQGGIVLGLSLMIVNEPEFKDFSNLLAGIIMGATIIHEFIGPFISKSILKKVNELNKK
ncbi:MAG: cation:proton antiporter [Chlorobi bacterium]|nr:cation:proton antiporter [Chlorobiota bacterium]